jgi:hypothetical protein
VTSASTLREAPGDQLTESEGTAHEETVRVLCEGLMRGEPEALNPTRYLV